MALLFIIVVYLNPDFCFVLTAWYKKEIKPLLVAQVLKNVMQM